MAVTYNLLMSALSGGINKQIVFRRVGTKTIVSAYPDMSNRKLSPKQLRVNGLLAEANITTKAIMRDQKKRDAAILRLQVPQNKLYTALIKEYFRNALPEGKIPALTQE